MGDTGATRTESIGQSPFTGERGLIARVLSLLQPGESTAIDLESVESLSGDALTRLLPRVQRRHQAQSLISRLPFSQASNVRILGPETGIPSTGAVLLAFQIGLELTVADLAPALSISEEDAGQEMYHARRSLSGSSTDACPRMRSLAGRYADPGLTRDQTDALVNHANACDQCRAVLGEFHVVDERIRTAVNTATVPELSAGSTQMHRNVLMLWAPILLVVVMGAVGLAAIGFDSATRSGPASLFAADEPGQHRGWLVMSSETEVMAIDLEHGERRRILENPAHDWWNPGIVSPNGQLVVRWEERTRIDTPMGALRAYDMNGQRRYLHRWEGTRSRVFSGWLDNQTVLFIERGPVQRVGVASEIPLEAQPSLIAADLGTGQERQIYQGPIDKAVAAQDGEHIAIVRPTSSPWPGKTVEIRPVQSSELGDPVTTVEQRFLSWTGRMLWSDDGQSLYLSLIPEDELPDTVSDAAGTPPSQYDFEHLSVARIGVDGSLVDYGDEGGGWTIVQSISPDESVAAVLRNTSGDRDGNWAYGMIDLESGTITESDESIPGTRWWNSEMLWLPDNSTRIIQQVSDHLPSREDDAPGNESLVLNELTFGDESEPMMVFHDATAFNLRTGHGLALLRWVPDDVVRAGDGTPAAGQPRLGTSGAVQHVNSTHQLFGGSSVAPTGRHILLERNDSDDDRRIRMVHMQAWAGTESDFEGASEFSWLPREPAMIGVVGPDDDNPGSRLVIVSSDRGSPMHNRVFDPAGIGGRSEYRYRKPVVSPDGTRLAFIVHDMRRDEMSLWISDWNGPTEPVTEWPAPADAAAGQTPLITWLDNNQILYAAATGWNDDYPQQVSLFRGEIRDEGDMESIELRSFGTGARDRGIDLVDVAIGPERRHVAFRLRHYTGRDPESDVSDTIHVSPTHDLEQSIELTRADPGEGLSWLNGDDWLLGGIDDRIALLEATGRSIEYLTDRPSAYPVLIGDGDIWYQDLEREGRIMRVSFSE